MTTRIGYSYLLPKIEIFSLDYLDVALEIIYGEDKATWHRVDGLLIFTSETVDLVGLREMLGDLGVTLTWPEFVAKELD